MTGDVDVRLVEGGEVELRGVEQSGHLATHDDIHAAAVEHVHGGVEHHGAAHGPEDGLRELLAEVGVEIDGGDILLPEV